jgi:hypothetical protein
MEDHGSSPDWAISSPDPTSTGNSWAWWLKSVISATVGSVKQEDHSPGWPGQKVRPYIQNNHSKKGWRYGSSSTPPAQQA